MESGHYPECNAVTDQYKNILPVVLVRETFVTRNGFFHPRLFLLLQLKSLRRRRSLNTIKTGRLVEK